MYTNQKMAIIREVTVSRIVTLEEMNIQGNWLRHIPNNFSEYILF